MNKDARDDIFENLSVNYEKVIARQLSEQIEVPELGDENGPAVWHIKSCPGWAISCYTQFDPNKHQIFYAAGMIVSHVHDMFGKPIFYDNERADGTPIPLKQRLDQLDNSRDQLASNVETDSLIDMFYKVMDARKLIQDKTPTADDVKEHSSTGAKTT